MAIDEAVSIAARGKAAPPTLRLYGWQGPSITIGYFQDPRRDVDAGACRSDGIPVIRRITGGRAVFHEEDLTYSVSASSESPLFPREVKGTFRRIAGGLLAGLKLAGVEAELYAPSERQERAGPSGTADCFLSPSWYEVIVKGKKLIGSAQKRWRRGFLQQGSIRRRPDSRDVGRYIQRRDERPEGMPRTAITSIQEVLGREMALEDLADCLARGFASTLGIEWVPSGLTPQEDDLVEMLLEHKYGNEAWNIERRLSAEFPADESNFSSWKAGGSPGVDDAPKDDGQQDQQA